MSGEDKAVYPSRGLPDHPTRPDNSRWPSPTPLPFYPLDEVAKALQQMLERLDRIEKRLENIERMLLQRQPAP